MSDPQFESFDEFYSFETYRSQQQDRSLSIIYASNHQNIQDASDLYLQRDIQGALSSAEQIGLAFKGNQQLSVIQNSVHQLAKQQAILQERLVRFGSYLSESRKALATTEPRELSADQRRSIEEQHELLKEQLADTRQKLIQHQIVIDNIEGPPDTKILPTGLVEQDNEELHTIEQSRDYNSQPSFVLFKKCCLLDASDRHSIFSDSNICVNLTRTQQGISVELNGSRDYALRMGTLESDNIDIPWSKFSQGKFVENCDIVNKQTQAVISVPVPLPLNYVFEQRLGLFHHPAKFDALAKLMTHCQLRIKHYDREVWQRLLNNPALYKFQKTQEQSLLHAVSIRCTSQLFLVRISLLGDYLTVRIGHKPKTSSDRLRDLLEFYGFLLAQ